MAINIKSDEADQLARQLAETTGENLTQAVLVAIRERLRRETPSESIGIADRLRRLARDVADLPVLDTRCPEDILGYDRQGLPS